MKTNLVAARRGACGTPELNELSAEELASIVGGDKSKSGSGKVSIGEIVITKEQDGSSSRLM